MSFHLILSVFTFITCASRFLFVSMPICFHKVVISTVAHIQEGKKWLAHEYSATTAVHHWIQNKTKPFSVPLTHLLNDLNANYLRLTVIFRGEQRWRCPEKFKSWVSLRNNQFSLDFTWIQYVAHSGWMLWLPLSSPFSHPFALIFSLSLCVFTRYNFCNRIAGKKWWCNSNKHSVDK